MLENDLINLVHRIQSMKTEFNHIEVKSAHLGTPKKLYDSISSFSNLSGGGIIVFGLDEGHNYSICGVYDVHDLQQQVVNQSLQMEPVVRPLFTVTTLEGKTIVSAEISECDIVYKPCHYKGLGKMKGSFIRVGHADLVMTPYEVYNFEVFKQKIQDELRLSERTSMEDFSTEKIYHYVNLLSSKKPNLVNLEKELILTTQGLVVHHQPTLGGLMVLGKYPQMYYPQLSMIAVVVPGREYGIETSEGVRFLDNIRIEGTIPEMVDKALIFVQKNTKTSTIIDDYGKRKDKTEYPMKAIREILLNAFLHRDYSIHADSSPVRLIIFNDRIEVENPGGLYGRITLDQLGNSSADTRNPFIAGALEVLMATENRFSGIPTIRKECMNYGLIPPLFEDKRGVFKVTIFNKKMDELPVNDELAREVVEFCTIPRTKNELAEKFGYKENRSTYFIHLYVVPLIQKGILKYTLPNKPKSKKQRIIRG